MKAVVYDGYAPNDDFKSILKVKEVAEPTPRGTQVAFRVKAAALNFNDIWGMRGQPVQVPLPVSQANGQGSPTACHVPSAPHSCG